MSYMIVYDRQFIKTSNGITIAVLHGDNNVWEPGNRKRARDWNCWGLDMSEEEVIDYFSKWHNDSDEHFKTNGKFLNNAGLDRWVKNGIKNALTVEDVLLANPHRSFECYLVIRNKNIPYGQKGHQVHELQEYIHTTEEFEKWIEKARKRMAEKKIEESVYAITSFGYEPIKHARISKEIVGKIIAKKGKGYVYEIKDNRWKTIGPDITKAMIFDSIEEAKNSVTGDAFTFIDAEKALEKNKERKYVILIKNYGSKIGYVTSVTKSRINHTYFSDSPSAKRYTEAEAKRQVKKLNDRAFSNGYEFIAEKISEGKT